MEKITRIVILFQITIIFSLGFYIYQKNKPIISVAPIDKNQIFFNKNMHLKYFYEPAQNTVIEKKPEWLKKSVKYSINADFLNERYDYDVKKTDNIFRIITLGDSFTFGKYVNTSDNYPEQLEVLLNKKIKCDNIKKFEVINLGVFGYDITYTVERYRLRGQKYNPDLVLWFLPSFSASFNRINEIRIPQQKKMYHDYAAQNVSTRKDDFSVNTLFINAIAKKIGEENIQSYQISSLQNFNRYYQNPLIFFSHSLVSSEKKKIIKEAMKNRTNVLYIDNVTLNKEDFLPDKHPNESGYKKIANNIFNYLSTDKTILLCK